MLYTPVLKVSGVYLLPVAVLAHSNIARNALRTSEFRFDKSNAVDPVSDELLHAFEQAGIRTGSAFKYSYGATEGEIDVLAYCEGRLFAFECKNSLHPCNIYELRQSHDYVQKAFSQLSRFRRLFANPDFRKYLNGRLPCVAEQTTKLSTCVVTGNHMFNGYQHDGHVVRSIYELTNVVTCGVADFILPTSAEGSSNAELRWKFWKGPQFSPSDLVDYLEGSSLHKVALRSMVSQEQMVPFPGRELRFESFYMDVRLFMENLMSSPQVERIDAKPDSNGAGSGRDGAGTC